GPRAPRGCAGPPRSDGAPAQRVRRRTTQPSIFTSATSLVDWRSRGRSATLEHALASEVGAPLADGVAVARGPLEPFAQVRILVRQPATSVWARVPDCLGSDESRLGAAAGVARWSPVRETGSSRSSIAQR